MEAEQRRSVSHLMQRLHTIITNELDVRTPRSQSLEDSNAVHLQHNGLASFTFIKVAVLC